MMQVLHRGSNDSHLMRMSVIFTNLARTQTAPVGKFPLCKMMLPSPEMRMRVPTALHSPTSHSSSTSELRGPADCHCSTEACTRTEETRPPSVQTEKRTYSRAFGDRLTTCGCMLCTHLDPKFSALKPQGFGCNFLFPPKITEWLRLEGTGPATQLQQDHLELAAQHNFQTASAYLRGRWVLLVSVVIFNFYVPRPCIPCLSSHPDIQNRDFAVGLGDTLAVLLWLGNLPRPNGESAFYASRNPTALTGRFPWETRTVPDQELRGAIS